MLPHKLVKLMKKVPGGTYMKNTSDCGLVISMSEELVYIPSIL